ncbi:hypothetical protein [Streptomyces sp. NPDC004726]
MAATTVLLLAALTACGGNGDDKQDAARSKSASASPNDDAGAGGDGTETGTAPEQVPMPLGKTVETIGAESPFEGGPGGGGLAVTPTTITYQKEAMSYTPRNGLFAIVTVKDHAVNATDAAEAAPIEGGGWQWIAPDGQALDQGDNEASSVNPDGFTGGGTVKAGSWAWRTLAFDISDAQKGGVLIYTDGAAQTYRWQMPKTEQGPELAALKKGMEGY